MQTEKIYKQIGDEIVELKDQELKDFLQYRADIAVYLEAEQEALNEMKANKISAYKKLGLTEAEINAIL